MRLNERQAIESRQDRQGESWSRLDWAPQLGWQMALRAPALASGTHLLAGPAVEPGAFASNAGTHPMMTVDENNLLRAEALLRTGDLQGAADLINITRTRSHTLRNGGQSYPGLPPVTAAGVPEGDSCVPRTDAGRCGDLMVALRYERMIELAMLDAIRGFADSRGFGLLPDGAWTQVPVPGGELQLYGIPNYSYGGVGSEHGAVYRPVTMADL